MKTKFNLLKQVLSIFLCMVMLLSYVPMTAFAAEDDVATITSSDSTEVYSYSSLSDAIANWDNGTTLTLLADIPDGIITETITIYDKTVTLNLNGHSLDMSSFRTAIEIGASGSLTIEDDGETGKIIGMPRSSSGENTLIIVYGNFDLTGGILNTWVSVADGATATMSGGLIEANTCVEVWGTFDISGGKLDGSRTLRNLGVTNISGSPEIYGFSVAFENFGVATISDTPVFNNSSWGTFWLNEPVVLNTTPTGDAVWSIIADANALEDSDGVWAVPGDGVTLNADTFISKLAGYDVSLNHKGELVLCDHESSQIYVSNGDETHNIVCYCGKTTYETNIACSGGVATDSERALCDYCKTPYGALIPEVHFDILAIDNDAVRLKAELLRLLYEGQTSISILLAPDADDDMFSAICDALRTSDVAPGSIDLTVAGVKVIPHSAFGNGHPEESLNTDPNQLRSINLPDAVTLETDAICAPYLEAICIPNVTEYNIWAIWGDTSDLNTMVLTANDTISTDFTGLYTNDIDLVLHCSKIDEVSDGSTWNGATFKSVSFVCDELAYSLSVTQDRIVETCKSGCGHIATAYLIINDTVSTVYNRAAIEALKVVYSDNWQGGSLEIVYSDNIDAGDASGKITIDGVTAENTFKIEPKVISISWGATMFLPYNGASKVPEAYANGLLEGDTCTLTTEVVETAEGAGIIPGTWTAKVTALSNPNYKLPASGERVTATFEIVTGNQNYAPVVSGVDETVDGKGDGKITGVDSTMEYCKEVETTYTAVVGTEITGLQDGVYYVRYAAKTYYNPSPYAKVTIGAGRKLTVTYKANGQVISTQTIEYGKDATAPEIPEKAGFVGKWDRNNENITADTEINAVYTKLTDVVPDDFKPEDKTELEDTKKQLEEMLEDGGYTEDDKKDIQDAIDEINDALEVIGNVENVEDLIDKIPDTVAKDDEDAIKAADDAYNALTDYEKSLVDEDAKKALDDDKAALAELNKPADTDSPQTGDSSNLWLWFALLFISGAGIFEITVYDRKRKATSKR